MATPLRVLIVEDNPVDAELAILHLTHAGFQPDWQRVETEADYLSALESLPELILSDWSLPQFNGMEALRLLTDRNLDIPFVILSGSVGDEAAIDALRKGADDYVLKDRPARLGESVRRSLMDKRLREKRRQAENALREAEEKYRAIFNGSLEGIFQSTPDGCFITANPALARMWGYETPEELISSITDIASQVYADPQRRDEFASMMEMDGEIHGFEYQAWRKDGTLMWASDNAHVVRDASGTLLYYEGSIEDVTERKRAEKALAASEAELRALVEQVPAIVYTESAETKETLYISPQVERLTGYTSAEWMEDRDLWKNMIPLEDLAAVLAEDEHTDATREPFNIEYRILTRDGRTLWIHDEATLIKNQDGTPLFWQGVMYDITERKRTEDALAASEAELRALFASMQDVVLVIDLQGVYRKIAPTDPSLLVKPPEKLLGRNLRDIFPAELAETFLSAIQQVLDTKQTTHIEYELLIDDRTVWFETSISPMDLDTTLWVARDVTERKQAEETLRESEKRQRFIFESLPVAVYSSPANPDYDTTWISGDVKRITGFEIDEYLSENDFWRKRLHPEDNERAINAYKNYPTSGELILEYRWRCKNGQYHWFHDRTILLENEHQKEYLGVIIDITERKRAEEKLSEQLNRLQLLRAIDTAIISSVELESNLQLIVQKTIEQLQIDAAAIRLLDSKTQTLNFAAGEGFHTNALQFTRLEIGKGAGRAAQERKIIHISNLQETTTNPALTQAIKDEGFIAYHGIPLIAKDQLLGVLEIFHRSSLPTDPDWLSFLETLAGQASISIDNATLFSDLQKSNTELVLAYDATLEGWSYALDLRDKETEGHTQRVTELAVKLARAMQLSEEEILHIKRGALLHDIGKMGIPDSILLKPDKLTDEEWVIMRQHPQFAYEMLLTITYLKPALGIPYCHHEKWDGTGYPRGLQGEQIPLEARIFAIVDVYDALTSDRPYRMAWSKEKTLEHIRSLAGTHFDPKVREWFFHLVNEQA